jgi:hypothetical protein
MRTSFPGNGSTGTGTGTWVVGCVGSDGAETEGIEPGALLSGGSDRADSKESSMPGSFTGGGPCICARK